MSSRIFPVPAAGGSHPPGLARSAPPAGVASGPDRPDRAGRGEGKADGGIERIEQGHTRPGQARREEEARDEYHHGGEGFPRRRPR